MAYLDSNSFFILGIKGAAMANIALILTQMKKKVTGVDVDEEFITDQTLTRAGVVISSDFSDRSQIDSAETVIYSAAHAGMHNELIRYAQERKKKIVHQIDLIAEFLALFPRSVAVAGCHGKTTTSSLLTHALRTIGADPSYCIGVPSYAGQGGASYQKGRWCVVEADEYGINPPADRTPKLLRLYPACSVVTNIDFDHPDVYSDIEHTRKVFMEFMINTKDVVVGCADDERVSQCMRELSGKDCVGYGFSEKATLRIDECVASSSGNVLRLSYKGAELGQVRTELFGRHNALNAAAVVAVLVHYDYSFRQIESALIGFSGVKRRMEVVWSSDSAVLMDDYAHHPNELSATIASCRQRFPQSRVVVVFQPHTFSRTQALTAEFSRSLSSADLAFVLPIFASARERAADFHVGSADIAKEAVRQGHTGVIYVSDSAELVQKLRALPPGKKDCPTVYVTVGAGDVYRLKNDIIEAIGTHTV